MCLVVGHLLQISYISDNREKKSTCNKILISDHAVDSMYMLLFLKVSYSMSVDLSHPLLHVEVKVECMKAFVGLKSEEGANQ